MLVLWSKDLFLLCAFQCNINMWGVFQKSHLEQSIVNDQSGNPKLQWKNNNSSQAFQYVLKISHYHIKFALRFARAFKHQNKANFWVILSDLNLNGFYLASPKWCFYKVPFYFLSIRTWHVEIQLSLNQLHVEYSLCGLNTVHFTFWKILSSTDIYDMFYRL